MTIPTYIEKENIGADQSLVTPTPTSNVLNLETDYGADMTGGTNERNTLQQALDDATSGDTVYIPEGTLLLDYSGVAGQPVISITSAHSGITLKGAGHNTTILLNSGHDTYNKHIIDVDGDSNAPSNFTIRDLKVDGNNNGTSNNHIRGVWVYESGSGTGNLVENVWATGCKSTIIRNNSPGCVVRYCTSYDGAGHGFAGDDWGVYSSQSNRILYEYCHAYNCGQHGLDASGGYTTVRHLLSEQNGYSGGKNTTNTHHCEWIDVVFRDNDDLGYLTTGPPNGDIHMTDVSAQNNPLGGFNFQGGTSYTLHLDNVQAIGNGTNNGNILLQETWNVNAGTIESEGATVGPGLRLEAGTTGSIDTYYHNNNNDGPIATGGSSLTIGTQTQQDITPKAPPTNDTSGGGGDGGSGGDTGSGGGSATASGTIIESWEGGSIGSAWGGNTGSFGVDTATASDGDNSLYYDGATVSGWHHLVSTSGLSEYPQQGDTFRWGMYIGPNAGGAVSVFTWAAQSATWAPNGYGVRINRNPSSSNTIQLEKDFTAFSASSASTTAPIPQSEWLTCVVDWADDGTMTFTLFDAAGTQLGQVSATDTTYTTGGLGFEASDSAGASPRFDAIQIDATSTSYVNETGSASAFTFAVRQNGTAVDCDAFIRQNGSAAPLQN